MHSQDSPQLGHGRNHHLLSYNRLYSCLWDYNIILFLKKLLKWGFPKLSIYEPCNFGGLQFFNYIYKSNFLKGNLQFLKNPFQGYISRFSIEGDLALEICIYMTRDCFVNLTPNILNDHLTKLLHISILGMQPFYCNNHY